MSEVVPSTFEEDLNPHEFEDIHEYPVATATHKAVEVYERLVVRPAALSHYMHSITIPCLRQDRQKTQMTDLT